MKKVLVSFCALLLGAGLFLGVKNSTQATIIPTPEEKADTSIRGLLDSNQEWLAMLTNMRRHTIKEMIITTTVMGTVQSAELEEGEVGGFEHYYIEKPGFYVYEGKIKLIENGELTTYYFSPRRMELMAITKVTEEGVFPASFEDIKEGSRIEIEESVDLSLSNINDKNVKFLNIKIY